MRYFGGKARISKEIASFIQPYIRNTYWEPFCGSCWTLHKVNAQVKIGTDLNLSLIYMWQAIQEGWEPPTSVSEDEYTRIQNDNRHFPLKAFAGFGCSFTGKWFGGYARSGDRNFAQNAYNSLMKKKSGILTTTFMHGGYDQILNPTRNWTIYCDPPYEGTTEYGATGSFDSKVFWGKVREWSKNNTVFVSEYNAPEDFGVVLEIETKTDIRTKEGREHRTEKIYKWEPNQ